MAKVAADILPMGVTHLTIDRDGDAAGNSSGFRSLYLARVACPGIRVKGVSRSADEDAADELADWIGERLALMSESRAAEEGALLAAWKSVFATRGE